MTTDNTTPRPWRLATLDRSRRPAIKARAGINGDEIVLVRVACQSDAQADADAALIVRGVNAHDALVAVACEVIDYYESNAPDVSGMGDMYLKARDALALAAGKQP